MVRKMMAGAFAALVLVGMTGCGDGDSGGNDTGGAANPDDWGSGWGGGTGGTGGGGTGGGGTGGGGTGGGGTGGGGTGGGGTGTNQTYSNGHPLTFNTTDAGWLQNETDVLNLVNSHRATIGKPALQMIDLMRQCARGHSAHMSTDSHGFFDHVNPEGDGPTQRYTQVGGSGGCGENIAGGYSTPAAAFDGWMSSPGHKANIEGDYTKTGIGYYAGPSYGHYWTQMFQ